MRKTTLKILAVGNSFSSDAMAKLYAILIECGCEEVVLGNLYIGACSLERHWNNARDNVPAYSYYKSKQPLGFMRLKKSGCTVEYAVTDEEWDVVTFQQSSAYLGFEDSYEPYLSNLIDYVRQRLKNKNAEFAWHFTWAFSDGYKNKLFGRYNFSSDEMYRRGVECLKKVILPHEDISFIIPSGTAVQNARSGILAAELSRDGRHMSLKAGQFTVSLVWAKVLVDADLSEVGCLGLSEAEEGAAKKAAESAVLSPFAVTVYDGEPCKIKYGFFAKKADVIRSVVERYLR